jgi:hypothetical protein
MTGQHHRKPPTRTWHSFAELPPRPDPKTGHPFPPHAPAYAGSDTDSDKATPRPNRFFGPPEPPEGMGRPLAWHYDNVVGNVRRYFVALAIVLVGIAILSLLRGDGLADLLIWQVWPVAVIGTYLMSDPLTFKTITAGSDWLQWGTRKRWYHRAPRDGHINTYELVSVTASGSGASLYLKLEDADGNILFRMRHALQQNRQIWDLLYNGILHSVANGAETDTLAIGILKLDETPALHLRDTHPESP